MSSTYCFSVHAEAEPSALPRVVEVFARLGHVPARCHVERGNPAGQELVIDAQLEALGRGEAEHVARCLGRLVSVIQVLWSEKRRHAA
jgi:acetolactate synthase small subunit